MSEHNIYLVRHGETAWSVTGQHTGRTDLTLTSHGEEQARGLEPRLKGLRFEHVLSSPLRRALRTCELAGFADRATLDSDLLEWDYGEYEGRTLADSDHRAGRSGCVAAAAARRQRPDFLQRTCAARTRREVDR